MKQIFGIYHKPLTEVSRELISSLHLSHVIVGKELGQVKKVRGTKTLPSSCPLYVVDGFSRLSLVPPQSVVILIECKPILNRSNCNKTLYPNTANTANNTSTQLKYALKEMLKQIKALPEEQTVDFTVKPLGLKELLKKATTYSFLNDIQTAIYKVNPYQFRKKIQNRIISYFYGTTSRSSLASTFKQHAGKLQLLSKKCLSKEGENFRLAVAQYLECGDENRVARETGFASFELLYIVRSHEKEAEIEERIRLGLPVPKAGRKKKKVDPILEKLRQTKLPNLRKQLKSTEPKSNEPKPKQTIKENSKCNRERN